MATSQMQMKPSVAGRRGRGRRRGGQQIRKGSEALLKTPYIKRGIPPYELLDDAALDRIEMAVDRILAEIGIEFREDEETVRLFEQAGGAVTRLSDQSWNVKFEPGLIRSLLKTAPAEFIQCARNPENNVRIGGDSVVFAPSYGSPFMMDFDGKRRYGTIEDFQNLIKLGQSSPWLHHSGGTICEPTDLSVQTRHLDMVYSHIRYSDRAFLGSITAPSRAEDSIEMARILFGADFLDDNCVIMGNFNSTSPLVWDGNSTKAIRAYAAAGQGSIHLPFLLGGAVSPLTMVGSVAQSLAESMVGCALTQLVRPGAPTILAGFLSTMSLRSGSPTFGTPEPALGSLVLGQMARRLKLPLRCAGNFSTSKVADGQAMQQGLMSMMSAVQCGANYILHSAGFLDGLLSMSYEKFVMDTDLCGAMHAYLKGLEVNDETLGVEALAEKGPGEHLFGCQHTLRHYETAYWETQIDDNDPYETWSENGGIDSRERANKRWKQLLADYETPSLDSAVDEALQDFMARRKEELKHAPADF